MLVFHEHVKEFVLEISWRAQRIWGSFWRMGWRQVDTAARRERKQSHGEVEDGEVTNSLLSFILFIFEFILFGF